MLLHQVIPALINLVRRFESHLLAVAHSARKVLSRALMGSSDLQEG
jgi:hypothetical protein